MHAVCWEKRGGREESARKPPRAQQVRAVRRSTRGKTYGLWRLLCRHAAGGTFILVRCVAIYRLRLGDRLRAGCPSSCVSRMGKQTHKTAHAASPAVHAVQPPTKSAR